CDLARDLPCALSACSTALQWPKLQLRSTLQCNVDLTPHPPNSSRPFIPENSELPMDLHLRGKRVLITGASKGIGAAAAEAFAEEGCHLRLAARSGDALKALAERLRSQHQIDASAWRHAWELKVFGYINLTRAIYAQMKARGGGVIVNDIGAAGEKFDANYICGSAGNAALMAFTRALGGKSLADNIRVVGINPGPVGTDRHVTLLKTRAKHQFGDENRYKEFQKGLP